MDAEILDRVGTPSIRMRLPPSRSAQALLTTFSIYSLAAYMPHAAPYTAYKHNMRPSLPRQRTCLTSKYPTRAATRCFLDLRLCHTPRGPVTTNPALHTCYILFFDKKHPVRRSSAPTRQRSDPRPKPSIAPHGSTYYFLNLLSRGPQAACSTYSFLNLPSRRSRPPYPYITWPGWPTCSKKPHIH